MGFDSAEQSPAHGRQRNEQSQGPMTLIIIISRWKQCAQVSRRGVRMLSLLSYHDKRTLCALLS